MTNHPAIPRVHASAGVDAITAALHEWGVVVIEQAAPAYEAQAAAFDLESYIRRTPAGEGVFYGKATRRNGALVKKSPTLAQWAINPVVLGVMEKVLGPHCDCFQINASQGIRIEPGEKAQFLHRDDGLFPIVPFLKEPVELMVNAMWALVPFTAENGATRAIPGSNHWPPDRKPEIGEAQPCCMEPGDVTLFLGSTQHGGGANRTSLPRTGAVFSYSLGWLRQTENCTLSVPWEDAKDLPERLQRLLGFQVHRPSLGWVEGVDPVEWYRSGRPDVGAAKDMLTDEQLAMIAEAVGKPEEFAAYVS